MFITTSESCENNTVNQLPFRKGGDILSIPCEKSGLHCSRFRLSVGRIGPNQRSLSWKIGTRKAFSSWATLDDKLET